MTIFNSFIPMLFIFLTLIITIHGKLTNVDNFIESNQPVISNLKDLQTYHFIIVGCGTGGATLASRLSENPLFRVICIEKGPDDYPNSSSWNEMNIPNDFNFISPHDPVIITTKQQLRQKPLYIATATGLGGTSRVYGMIDVRPSPENLASWPQGWHYEDLLPYYKKLEDHYCYYDQTDISSDICKKFHGKNGPMQVNNMNLPSFHNLSKAFKEICDDTNQPWKGYLADYNGNLDNRSVGCSVFQQFKHRLNRTSNNTPYYRGTSRTGYLNSTVLSRPNLFIIMNSLVTRILFDENKKAIGVEYFHPISHTIKRIYAEHEIILSAGAFNTPHLLQISGIGDPEHLKKINVTLVSNNTQVGKNLNDRLSLPYVVQLNNCDEDLNYINGPFSWIIQFNSGIRKNLNKNIRDIQIYLMDTSDGLMTYSSRFCSEQSKRICNKNSPTKSTFRIVLQQNDFLHGTVLARTNSIFDKPAIDLGWHEISEIDKQTISNVFDLLRSYTRNKSSEFGQLISHEILPGQLTIDEYLSKHLESALHPSSTCQMGLCTDDELIVRGIKSLRVCDTSVFASQLDANPSATIFAIAEKLAEKLLEQYQKNQPIGTWHIHDTLWIFQSENLVASSKIASFDLDETIIISNQSDWHFLNKNYTISRLRYLSKHGYKIVIFTNQFDLCSTQTQSFNSQYKWQMKIEMLVKILQIPIQIFAATCNDHYAKPSRMMWRDFNWLFNEGIDIDVKSSFHVGRNNEDSQFAANIPIEHYLPEQQFSNQSKKYFHVIQSVQISVSANVVWKLVGDFYQIHKWHPQILASEMNNEENIFKRRVIFQNEMIDTIEQLESYDQTKREYYYKNIGGNWGRLVENYRSSIHIIEDNNDQSCIVQWIGSFYSDIDRVTEFYRIGLNSLADLFSPPLPCSNGNTYSNKTFLMRQNRPSLSVYWRQEYNINASTLWKLVGVWKGKLNGQFSLEPGSEYSFKLPDPKPQIYESLLSYDQNNYEFTYCMRPTNPRSLPVTNYVSMKKVVATSSTSSAWIRTASMIVDDGTTVDEAANQVLMDVFVAGGERLRQQIQNTTELSY